MADESEWRNRIRRLCFWRWIKPRRLYLGRWVCLIVVSAVVGVVYWAIVEYVQHLAEVMHAPVDIEEFPEYIVAIALKVVAGVLFWWRVVKVVVFLGSPFRLGLAIGHLRENGAENGRPVRIALVEGRGQLLFGVLARSHPRSDKLVRYRVEMLVMAMPCGRSLLIRGSSFSWLKPDGFGNDHARREEFFKAWRGHHPHWQRHEMDERNDSDGMGYMIRYPEPGKSDRIA